MPVVRGTLKITRNALLLERDEIIFPSTESVCDLPAYNFNHSSQRVNDIHPGQSAKDMYQNQVLHTPVRVTLEQYQLWQQFHSVGTEMILTKSGRYVERYILLAFYLMGASPRHWYGFHVHIKHMCIVESTRGMREQ